MTVHEFDGLAEAARAFGARHAVEEGRHSEGGKADGVQEGLPTGIRLKLGVAAVGEIGGLAGGDAKCQAAADAANLDGTFKAWLSFGLDTPETRFTNLDNAGPYRLVANGSDGGNPPPKVADNFADLFTCGSGTCLDNAISRDENGGTPPTPQLVWTGTEANGTAAADTCSGWTSTLVNGLGGVNSGTTESWTDFGVATACTSEGRLYCFQQAI